MLKAIEELNELGAALCKYIATPLDREAEDHVCEEIADAWIMMERLLLLFDCARVQEWTAKKLRRLAQTLGTDGAEGGIDEEK